MGNDNSNTPVVLIVDDVEMNVKLLKKMVEKIGFVGVTATSANAAVRLMDERMPQLILLDIVMPDINGYQFCELLKSNPLTNSIPIIFVSAANELDDKMKAYELGAADFINKPFDFAEVAIRVKNHIKMSKMQFELEDSNRRLSYIVSEQAKKFEEEQKRLLRALGKLAEGTNQVGMKEHLNNVSYNSRLLAQALNFTEKYDNKISNVYVEAVELAAAVHDIGKITVPDRILQKKEELDEDEWEIVKKHTEYGDEIIRSAYPDVENNIFIKLAADVVRHHHENWDGSGYPDALKGEDIPFAARIVKIADEYDSMLSERVYRKPAKREEAIEFMVSNREKRFDPYILDVFLKIEKQFKKPE